MRVTGEEDETQMENEAMQGGGGRESSHGEEIATNQQNGCSVAPQIVAPAQVDEPQQQPPSLASLSSTACTDPIFLVLFLLHAVVATTTVSFLLVKAGQGAVRGRPKEKELLAYWFPQVEGSAILSVILALAWQRSLQIWPVFMVSFIPWSSFAVTLSAGVLVLFFSMSSTDGLGVVLVAFAIGNALYACWAAPRIHFTSRILSLSQQPLTKFQSLTQPTYWMLGMGFVWTSLWSLAVIGSLNFYLPPLIIIALVLSLALTLDVMRNTVNITVNRVLVLYYLRGMQSDTWICFQRSISRNIGSACLGSLLIPVIEAIRISARVLNLIERGDGFVFSRASCCLRVVERIFRFGNGWAFMRVAAYGLGLVRASQSTWELFERNKMESIAESDMTSRLCFLAGVASGSTCVVFSASWTFSQHRTYTATVSLTAFFIGYLFTRIGMALTEACVCCYYASYAENPSNQLLDSTIGERIQVIQDVQFATAQMSDLPRVPV